MRTTLTPLALVVAHSMIIPALEKPLPPTPAPGAVAHAAADRALREAVTSRSSAAERALLRVFDHEFPSEAARVLAAWPAEPRYHVVQPGDTLWDLARRFGVSVEDLMAANELGHSDWIRPGQRLRLASTALPRQRQVARQVAGRSGVPRSSLIPSPAGRRLLAGGFAWPSRGVLTSRFGRRYRSHHDGVDLAAPWGTPFYAAADGVVTFAGWKSGYGLVVHVDHGDGVVTVYGHASRVTVQAGQRVRKGQLIGRVGCTGACTGPHLHFEVRVDGRATDPLNYLVGRR